MEYVNINAKNREKVNAFILEHWFSTEMVTHGIITDMTKTCGIVALENGCIAGLLTYAFHKKEKVCEIMSLNSLTKQKGVGTTLVNKAINIAKEGGCDKITVITTNDNINAIRFYQKRGFDMAHFYRNSVEASRKIKPSIPLLGENGIPLKHEIEFEIDFAK